MERIKFKGFAGVKIDGTINAKPKSLHRHLGRAEYLTALVESNGKYGCVMNYDGTGMTAGIHQAIAVYPRELAMEDHNPKNDQGPLWKLMNRIGAVCEHSDEWNAIREMFSENDWYLAQEGTLRYICSGHPVPGLAIRDELSGAPSGLMPKAGRDRERAEHWVLSFHKLFSKKDTFRVQRNYGMEHFIKRAERTTLRFSTHSGIKRKTIQDAVYGLDQNISICLSEDLDPVLDLGMCMFWSHSVNAPGAALKKLCKIVKPWMGKEELGTALIQKLGNTKFGRWDDDIKNGRYQRTRTYAMDLNIWPKEMFVGKSAVMPKNLKG